ncbi:hypothetical protein [Haladaptatus salinisoli]|uniref:hypothetical protein n=1 Tax=Haladaptatus salinisoli TaxID=2884876 RepID=UPI001D0B71AB|nr:hypothetical protein [Haladaptatus salinisoli]
MNRRRFAALLGLGGFGVLGGCVDRLPLDDGGTPAKPVSVRVRSYFDERRVVSVDVEGTRAEEGFEDVFHLWPGRVVTQENVLEAGTYHVRVEVDNDMWRAAEWRMYGCPTNTILVDVGKDGVGIAATCRGTDGGSTA